jgi:hypothetical protein
LQVSIWFHDNLKSKAGLPQTFAYAAARGAVENASMCKARQWWQCCFLLAWLYVFPSMYFKSNEKVPTTDD